MKRKLLTASEIITILLLVTAFIACNGGSDDSSSPSPLTTLSPTPAEDGVLTESGLRYIELKEGEGPHPRIGDTVIIQYTGTLEDGTKFDSTYDRDTPFAFTVGKHQAIDGLDQGVRLMKAGGKARLVVPPELGYGDYDAGSIPGGSTLIFDVELVSIIRAKPPTAVPEEDYHITESGLKYYDITVGTGTSPEPGELVLINFIMWLADGTQIRSSADLGGPSTLVVGGPDTLAGFSEGLESMRVGGKRQLVIPPDLAHGEKGSPGGLVPPNATLTVEVELLAVIPAWEPGSPTEVDNADYLTTESGLKYYDLVVGDGPLPESGQTTVVQYAGWLIDGTQFTSSLESGQPIVAYKIGSGKMPKGFDEGVATMRVGGKRQLVIPPELGYGDKGKDKVPPNSTLIFEVKLFYAF